MTYKELNILHKYVYNRVDYVMFSKAMKECIPYCSDEYIQGKWDMFIKSPIQFTASFDKRFFNYFIKLIYETNYKG